MLDIWRNLNNRQKIFILIGFICFVLFIAIFAIFWSKNEELTKEHEHLATQLKNASKSSSDHNHKPGKEIYKDTMIFKGRYFINDSVGVINSAIIIDQIEPIVLDKQDRSTAPRENSYSENLIENYYTASIKPPSYKSDTVNEATNINFTIDVSDGRVYEIYAIVITDPYIEWSWVATAAKRIDKTSDKLFCYTDIEENDDRFSQVKTWLNSLRLNVNNGCTFLKDKL